MVYCMCRVVCTVQYCCSQSHSPAHSFIAGYSSRSPTPRPNMRASQSASTPSRLHMHCAYTTPPHQAQLMSPEQVISGLVRADSQASPSRQHRTEGWSVPWGRATREGCSRSNLEQHGELSMIIIILTPDTTHQCCVFLMPRIVNRPKKAYPDQIGTPKLNDKKIWWMRD